MRKIIKMTLMIVLVLVVTISMFACNINTTVSSKTHALNNVSYSPNQYITLENEISTKMTKSAYHIFDILREEYEKEEKNFVVSPLSIYMAFSLLDYIGDEETKKEVSEFLNLSEEDIKNSKEIFDYLVKTRKDDAKKVISQVSLTNSIWMDKDQGFTYNQDMLDEMAELLYCYAYETPFSNNNKAANDDIRKFVKKNTNGLIDRDFELPASTLFALINTLYFKDNWNNKGSELNSEEKKFYQGVKELLCEFLISNYVYGVAVEDEIASSMYATTSFGYRITFVVPKDGHTLTEAMESKYLYNLTTMSHTKSFDETKEHHYTRTLFPLFNVSTSMDMMDVLASKNMFNHTFSAYKSNLVDTDLQVSKIIHDAVLKVDKKGIEGAAVTIIANKATSAGPDEITDIYHDFLVDKPFGFILSTYDGIVLFMGEINNPLE